VKRWNQSVRAFDDADSRFTNAFALPLAILLSQTVDAAGSRDSASAKLVCRESFAVSAPDADFDVVLGVVSTQLRQVLRNPSRSEFDDPSARLFAKSAYPSVPVDDVLPAIWKGPLSLGLLNRGRADL
jgi:hypothetical protein